MTTSKQERRDVARARAGANFALVKYWGKADARLNVPAVGSISITLDALFTETTVELAPGVARDELMLNGMRRDEDLAKVSACLDLLRRKAAVDTRARVASRNNFPTGAGLASSASGFAALVRAARSGIRAHVVAARAQHRRSARVRLRGAFDLRRFRRDACGHCGRRQRQFRRAAARECRLAARGRDRRDREGREGDRLAQRHDALGDVVAVLRGVGGRATAGSCGRQDRDSGSGLRGARRACRAQLLEDARRGARGSTAARLLERRDRRMPPCRAAFARRRRARVLHDRRRAAAQSRLRARRRAPSWRPRCAAVPGVLELATSALGPGAELY